MCNNNGECRKSDPGVMCPSYRATADEQHVTRGRANTLRLALTGQLGEDALVSDEMRQTMELCVGCKGCKRECPNGVDMARMKIEFLHQYKKRHGITLRDRLVAYLPRYAPVASKLGPLLDLRNRLPPLAWLGERFAGLSARRKLPAWHRQPYRAAETGAAATAGEVVLLVDTFNRWFEPENARAAERVLRRAGYRVHTPAPSDGGRPLCCGRTFLAAGLVDEAKTEARRMIATLLPFVERGVKIVGLEPSCLLTLRDEFGAMLGKSEADALAGAAMLFEEFVASERAAGRFALAFTPLPQSHALLHGHCHQKAFDTVGALAKTLALVPGLTIETFDSTCCGMAGAFGYEAEHYDVSMQIGELGVLPAMRAAAADTLLVAGGTSCRHQIADGAGRSAIHVARVLDMASAGTP
jgi:Fe-S oxidoreductase